MGGYQWFLTKKINKNKIEILKRKEILGDLRGFRENLNNIFLAKHISHELVGVKVCKYTGFTPLQSCLL